MTSWPTCLCIALVLWWQLFNVQIDDTTQWKYNINCTTLTLLYLRCGVQSPANPIASAGKLCSDLFLQLYIGLGEFWLSL